MQKWKDIWGKKTWQPMTENPDEFALFCELKKANGFDVAVSDEEEYYKYFYEKWNSMYQTIASMVKQPIRSVFEVGCGSGVNLMLFQNRGVDLLGGIDYSESLIDVCRKIVRGGYFVRKQIPLIRSRSLISCCQTAYFPIFRRWIMRTPCWIKC